MAVTKRPTEVYGVKCNQQGWTQNGSPIATEVMMSTVFASYAAAEGYISKLLRSAEEEYTDGDDYRDCAPGVIQKIAMLKQNFTPILVGNQGKSYPLYEVVELSVRG